MCSISFCFYLCSLLERAQTVFCCAFFPLAVEPFNTQPQLHYIALSRSYKGSFSAWCLVLAGAFLFQWSWRHALSHRSIFLLTTSKHASVALRWLKFITVFSLWKLFLPPCHLRAGNLWESLVVKMGGCLPPEVRLIKCAWRCANMLWAAVFLVWIFFSGCEISFRIHFSWSCHLKGKQLTQWYLLNLCLVLLCLQNRQLQGLKGLFNKNPRHSSSENSSHYVRKRSIGDRILRRTASAPAKGRKKSKMGFQEMVEVKDSVSEAARDQDGVLRRTARSLQARPVSMPVDRSLLGALSLPISETAKDTEGKENSLGKML